jgi:hypothetical protein
MPSVASTPSTYLPTRAGTPAPPSRPRAPPSATYRPTPDFNPIENAFAKLKATLRKAAARSLDDLWTVIGTALPQFTPAECANLFTAAGYEPE